MPELPEVESVGRALAAGLMHRRLTGLRVSWDGVFEPSARAARAALVGRRLAGLHRHGKYLIARFAAPGAADTHLMIHLRMTGQFLSQPDYVPDGHVHATFDFDGLTVHFRDVRKFGRLTLVEHPTAPAARDAPPGSARRTRQPLRPPTGHPPGTTPPEHSCHRIPTPMGSRSTFRQRRNCSGCR